MIERNKFKYGKKSNAIISTVSEYLELTARKALKCSPIDFGIPRRGGLRIAVMQNDLFKKGWSKCDGYDNLSFHQEMDKLGRGQALDLVPYIQGLGLCYEALGRLGVIGMLMLEAWEELKEDGLIPKDLYLHWGGLWSNSDPVKLGWDLAHYEIRSYAQKEKIR